MLTGLPRTVRSLRINCAWLLLYIHNSPKQNRMWLDDVVVATQYIGPIAASKD